MQRLATAACLMIAVCSTAALAQQTGGQNRSIANATYILGVSGTTANRDLKIYSSERAALLGQFPPALVQKFDQCTYAIRAKGTYGLKVNFALIGRDYQTRCSGSLCELTFSGPQGAIYALGSSGEELPKASFRTNPLNGDDMQSVLGTFQYFHEAGCGPYDPGPPKPRF